MNDLEILRRLKGIVDEWDGLLQAKAPSCLQSLIDLYDDILSNLPQPEEN